MHEHPTLPAERDPGAPPVVGLVTVTYNSADVIGGFLASLDAQDVPGGGHRLYVIDNASTDATAARLTSASIPFVANATNLGFARATNQGVRRALEDGCEYVLLINNDTGFGAGFLAELVSVARRHGVRVLSPTIRYQDTPDRLWYGGGDVREWRGMRPELFDAASGADGELVTTKFVSGCCLLLHRDVVERVGLLDEDFFVYCEDVDYSLRLARAGVAARVATGVVLDHAVGAITGGYDSPFSLRQRVHNQVLVIRKHGHAVQRVAALLYLQVWIVLRLLARRESARAFAIREAAFVSGLRDDLSDPPRAGAVEPVG